MHSAAVFFFSSRRRHTRYIGDWSSDVCSSDLLSYKPVHKDLNKLLEDHRSMTMKHISKASAIDEQAYNDAARSEERRGGKESRCRRSPSSGQTEKRRAERRRCKTRIDSTTRPS